MIDKIRKAYTREAKIYDGARFESKVGRFYYEIEKSRILGWLKGPKILELGCGTGRYIVPFAKLGFECTGIDLTPAMLEVARKKADAIGVSPKLMVMDAHSLDFKDNTFDSVFCDRTFKFLNPERSLKEVYRVLKPGGRVIIDTEVRKEAMGGALAKTRFVQAMLWHLVATKETRNMRATGGKILPGKLYTKPELEGMIKRTGFDVLECRRMLWLPSLLVQLLPYSVLGKLSTRSWIENVRGPKLLAVGEK